MCFVFGVCCLLFGDCFPSRCMDMGVDLGVCCGGVRRGGCVVGVRGVLTSVVGGGGKFLGVARLDVISQSVRVSASAPPQAIPGGPNCTHPPDACHSQCLFSSLPPLLPLLDICRLHHHNSNTYKLNSLSNNHQSMETVALVFLLFPSLPHMVMGSRKRKRGWSYLPR